MFEEKCNNESMMQATVKVSHGDDIRRFVLDQQSVDWHTLRSRVLTMYGLEPSDTYVLKYRDDEDDMITIASDDDLKEALRITKFRLRVELCMKEADAANAMHDIPRPPPIIFHELRARGIFPGRIWKKCKGNVEEFAAVCGLSKSDAEHLVAFPFVSRGGREVFTPGGVNACPKDIEHPLIESLRARGVRPWKAWKEADGDATQFAAAVGISAAEAEELGAVFRPRWEAKAAAKEAAEEVCPPCPPHGPHGHFFPRSFGGAFGGGFGGPFAPPGRHGHHGHHPFGPFGPFGPHGPFHFGFKGKGKGKGKDCKGPYGTRAPSFWGGVGISEEAPQPPPGFAPPGFAPHGLAADKSAWRAARKAEKKEQKAAKKEDKKARKKAKKTIKKARKAEKKRSGIISTSSSSSSSSSSDSDSDAKLPKVGAMRV